MTDYLKLMLATGYVRRLGHLNDSKTLELIGRLHRDLFSSYSMHINVVGMNIKLTRAPSSFYLLGPADDSEVYIKIMDANLFVTQAELSPTILLAHVKVLSQKKVQYPVNILR
jgi:hypothetical protein